MNLSDQEFKDIRLLVQRLSGIWLGEDKQYLIRSRLEPVLRLNKLSSYAELVLQSVGVAGLALQEEIIEAITTKETSFNRDGHPFEEFRRTLLPELIRNKFDRQRSIGLPFGKLRIWSAASSTGNEAYSLAMAILEYIEAQAQNGFNTIRLTSDSFQILASDISEQALQKAREGSYYEWELDRGLSNELKLKYFDKNDSNFTVKPAIRAMVEFKRLNLIKPFADINGFDLVLCRNLLIYFDQHTRREIVEKLVNSLTQGGILMLGASESLTVLPKGLVQSQVGRTVVYRKASS